LQPNIDQKIKEILDGWTLGKSDDILGKNLGQKIGN